MRARHFVNWIKRGKGASAAEYIVMIILAAMFLIAIIRVFGPAVSQKFTDANDELSGTLASDSSSRDKDGSGDSVSGQAGKDGANTKGGDGKGGSGGAAGGQGSGAGGGKGGGDGKGGKGGGKGGKGGSGGSGSGGGGDGDGGSGGSGGGGANGDGAGAGGGGGCNDDGEESAGFNPAILLAALFLVGLLIYVMVKGQK